MFNSLQCRDKTSNSNIGICFCTCVGECAREFLHVSNEKETRKGIALGYF